GLFSIGGPLEDKGRLKYINNCSDTLLVPPPKLGEPCLNALYFPANTVQTSHTHPSFRVGIVSSGAGFCLTQNSQYELRKGTVFLLPENTIHSFKTVGENSSLVVFAFHPDSDFGPTDENHPMINRTII
nr:AraC family ligand binding domain-containing protein [Pseudomonadota bacterium]